MKDLVLLKKGGDPGEPKVKKVERDHWRLGFRVQKNRPSIGKCTLELVTPKEICAVVTFGNGNSSTDELLTIAENNWKDWKNIFGCGLILLVAFEFRSG